MTTYIGLDLAWSAKNRSGLAILDFAGRLIGLGEAVTDDEILEWITPYIGDCVVSIDAPIVVTNETGQRPCERDLSAVFHRFHAGTHPTNLSKPEFAAGSRAQILCDKAALDFDPTSSASARAIEVYPHPATITLFGLDTIIPNKHKSGREFADLQTSLLELLTRLESLSTAEPPLLLADSEAWQETVATVRRATQKSHLGHVEDRIDAVLCAYVGLLYDRMPERSLVIGDTETGYIVVPIDDRVREKIDALGAGT